MLLWEKTRLTRNSLFHTETHFPHAVNVVKEDSEYLIVGISPEDQKMQKCENYEVQYMSIDMSAMESELGKEHTEEE